MQDAHTIKTEHSHKPAWYNTTMLLKITAHTLIKEERNGVTATTKTNPRTYIIDWDCEMLDLVRLKNYGDDNFRITQLEPHKGNALTRRLNPQGTITASYREMYTYLRNKP